MPERIYNLRLFCCKNKPFHEKHRRVHNLFKCIGP